MNTLLYLENKLRGSSIEGYGFIEDYADVEPWKIRGFFSIGAYTKISNGVNARDFIVGRFSKIDSDNKIGFFMGKKNQISNSDFAYGLNSFNTEEYKSIANNRFYFNKYPLTEIGNDVWVQENCIIKPGVTISDGVIVLPNSVVIDDLPPYSICCGNPAKVIDYRFDKETIEKILEKKWWECDIFNLKDFNFSDVNSFINLDLKEKKYKRYYYDFNDKRVVVDDLNKVLIGPSHVQRWRDKICTGELFNPNFYLIGFSGLSINDKSIEVLIRFFKKNEKDIFLMIPDFRIGNSILLDGDENSPATFIDKKLINIDNDKKLFEKSVESLDKIISLDSEIKFIFWCLGVRESLNRKEFKYFKDDLYFHPTWNLNVLQKKYSRNCIKLDSCFDFSELIENDGTVHPKNVGYNYIKNLVNSRDVMTDFSSNYIPNILIRTYRWDGVNDILAQYYEERGANVIFVVDETLKKVDIPNKWKKVSITKEKILNAKLRYQEDIMWRSGDYCYYFAFKEYPEMQNAWLIEDEAIIYSENFNSFLFSFEKYNIDFYAGKFGKRAKNNYLYKTIEFINKYPYGCIYSVSMMSRKYSQYLYERRVELTELFVDKKMDDSLWMNDEYFSINMSYNTPYIVASLTDIHRWSCSQTLHFSSQKVLMESDRTLKFEFKDRFYHPILIKNISDLASIRRNEALLSKMN